MFLTFHIWSKMLKFISTSLFVLQIELENKLINFQDFLYYRYPYEISQTANGITKIPRSVKAVVSYLQKASFLVVSEVFLVFRRFSY